MSLTPALKVNFDGLELAPDETSRIDADGVGHFHPIKAGSTFEVDLKLNGVDTTAFTWAMDMRASVGATETLLNSGSGGGITLTPDPNSSDTEILRVAIPAASTATLQSNGLGMPFVYDIEIVDGARRDRWISGSGIVTPEVTRTS